jgi:hypothetical protein
MLPSTYWRCCCRRARFSSLAVLGGPITSSASVKAETATIKGRLLRSMMARSTATDVSIRPRSKDKSVARRRVLIDVTVDVRPELLVVDAGRAFECVEQNVPWDELAGPVWAQLTDGSAVPSHDEVLAPVERPHHLAAVVAKLPLGQFPRHRNYRSTRAPLKFGFPKGFGASERASHQPTHAAGRRTMRGGPEPRQSGA